MLALIKVPQAQAEQVQIGQSAEVNTRRDVIAGTVSRITQEVQEGTVTVEIQFSNKTLPASARPELSVDATIFIAELTNTLYIERPVNVRPHSEGSLYRTDAGGLAEQVPVTYGEEAGKYIQILAGANPQEHFIISDTSQFDAIRRITITNESGRNILMRELKIKMSNITKIFSTDEMETHALQGIDLDIFAGDFVSICGPSGCGKSTLLSILGLLDNPTSGSYLIEGRDVSNLSLNAAAELRNEKIGFIFQSFNLIDELSVFDNVALPLRYRNDSMRDEEIATRVQQCLQKVDMAHRSKHRPNQLSGGQQQRIAIARALVANPAILLIDEPTGNLDSKNGDAVMNMLKQLNAERTTLCMVTHDPRYADFAGRKLHLLDGRITDSQVVLAEAG